MNPVAKFGGGAVLVAVAALIGSNAIKQDRSAAIERFALTETELHVMRACEDTVSRQNIEFKSGVETITGCGCIARNVADAVPAAERGPATAVMAAVIAGGDPDSTPDSFEQGLRSAQSAHQLSEDRLLRYVSAATDAIAHCAQHESHMTETELAEAEVVAANAETERLKDLENSKVALDRLVAAGHMTRKEADARLARMQQ